MARRASRSRLPTWGRFAGTPTMSVGRSRQVPWLSVAPRNPLPDLLEADDVKVPHDVDAKETAGDGADERVEVRVPLGEQAETPLELRPRWQFVRVRERQPDPPASDYSGLRNVNYAPCS